MNSLNYIQKKLNLIQDRSIIANINIILNHLSVAESHFANGIQKNDDNFFNDVIYRTNQAYEGILRLAYTSILKKSDKNKNNKEIEEILLKENIINERTKNYLSLYRDDFRNRSSHDYKIYFTESDAYLAINNVNGFLYTLVNQLLIYDAYLLMQQKNEEINAIAKKIFKEDINFLDHVTKAILSFPRVYYKNPKGNSLENEFYTIGELEAYLNKINPEWNVVSCQSSTPEINSDGIQGEIVRADLIIDSGSEKVIIEICSEPILSFRNNFIKNMKKYLKIFNAKYGLIFQITGKGEYQITTEITDPLLIQRIHKKEEIEYE